MKAAQWILAALGLALVGAGIGGCDGSSSSSGGHAGATIEPQAETTFMSTDNAVMVHVPENAALTPAVFTVAETTSIAIAQLPIDASSAGSAYALEPSGSLFARPVEVTMDYTLPAGATSDDLLVIHISGGDTTYVRPSSVGPSQLMVELTSFSTVQPIVAPTVAQFIDRPFGFNQPGGGIGSSVQLQFFGDRTYRLYQNGDANEPHGIGVESGVWSYQSGTLLTQIQHDGNLTIGFGVGSPVCLEVLSGTVADTLCIVDCVNGVPQGSPDYLPTFTDPDFVDSLASFNLEIFEGGPPFSSPFNAPGIRQMYVRHRGGDTRPIYATIVVRWSAFVGGPFLQLFNVVSVRLTPGTQRLIGAPFSGGGATSTRTYYDFTVVYAQFENQ